MASSILIFILIFIVFKTTVHQTLKDKNNPDYIEDHGPFPGENIGKLYLGQGTYFWDDHIDLAHWWGKAHIGGEYIICQADLEVEDTSFFDLVGCRQDMIYLRRMISDLSIGHLKLGMVIEFLKDLQKYPNNNGIFPFKVIRAVDVSNTTYNKEWIYFAENKKGETSLTPVYLICLIAESNVILSSYKIVYPEKYVQKE